jgi:hypothetical protein
MGASLVTARHAVSGEGTGLRSHTIELSTFWLYSSNFAHAKAGLLLCTCDCYSDGRAGAAAQGRVDQLRQPCCALHVCTPKCLCVAWPLLPPATAMDAFNPPRSSLLRLLICRVGNRKAAFIRAQLRCYSPPALLQLKAVVKRHRILQPDRVYPDMHASSGGCNLTVISNTGCAQSAPLAI